MGGFAQFLNITSQIGSSPTGNLTRSPLIVTRETVSGFTVDSETGIYKINKSDLESFKTLNPSSLALISNLDILFGQVYTYPYCFILSKPFGITTADLTKANRNYREWSFITIADTLQCSNPLDSQYDDYIEDLQTIKAWNLLTHKKIVFNTISAEETSNAIDLPTEFLDKGDFVQQRIKTIVSDDKELIGSVPVYRNTALAILSFCINGIVLARSFGSFSDAHDFEIIEKDSYSDVVRSYIENENLGQYNDRKDRTGKSFFYDTLMNDLSLQLETLTSADYIEDFVYVYVNNKLTASGFTGLPNDDSGIQIFVNLIRDALQLLFENGLILSRPDNSIDASVSFLTASQVTAIDPSWQSTGVWVNGMFVARVKPFASAHYIPINFIF